MIHFITPEYLPRRGGVAAYTHQVAAELANLGETVHVWGPSDAEQTGGAIAVHSALGPFGARDLKRASVELDGLPAPRRLIVQWVPHGYGKRAMNLPFCLWLWRRSVAGDSIDLVVHEPFVTFTGGVRKCVVAAVQRVMTLMVLSAARRVWVTTQAWSPLLEPYLRSGGAIEWLPVPSSLHSATDAQAANARAKFVSGDACLVGHFGTYGPLVTSLLAEAVPMLARSLPRARFLLIGTDSERFRSSLVERHRGLAGRVSATGTLDAVELAAHISACDVLLQPYPDGVTSRRTTTMAGLFARVPVVTTHGALTERFWRNGGVVKLADVGDTAGIVGHVLQLLADPEARRRQADAGRAFYDQWFDVRHTVAALRSVT